MYADKEGFMEETFLGFSTVVGIVLVQKDRDVDP